MLKIVVFDCGYGGEFFADQLKNELPILEVIRVIDWRHANEIQSSPKKARKYAEIALSPYIGRADVIIFANYLLSITSLKYFKRKYKTQSFIGLKLKYPDSFVKYNVLILATKPITKTINYHNFLFHLKRETKTLSLDDWPAKIDDGELSGTEVRTTIQHFLNDTSFDPKEIILACSQFSDIREEILNSFSHNIKIYDGFSDTIRECCKKLNLRGGLGKRAKQ